MLRVTPATTILPFGYNTMARAAGDGMGYVFFAEEVSNYLSAITEAHVQRAVPVVAHQGNVINRATGRVEGKPRYHDLAVGLKGECFGLSKSLKKSVMTRPSVPKWMSRLPPRL